jgi:hypothetical protein
MHYWLTRKLPLLIVFVLGFVFAADALALAADDATPRAVDAMTLSSNIKPKDIIADRESDLKRTLLNPGESGFRGDNGHGERVTIIDDPQPSRTAQCSTEVILATFFKSRYCTSGTLVVAASSSLRDTANLEVVGYGPMKWDNTTRMWVMRIQNLETNPGMVTVAGAECTAQGEIMAVPYGCDARIEPGSASAQ